VAQSISPTEIIFDKLFKTVPLYLLVGTGQTFANDKSVKSTNQL